MASQLRSAGWISVQDVQAEDVISLEDGQGTQLLVVKVWHGVVNVRLTVRSIATPSELWEVEIGRGAQVYRHGPAL